MSLEKPTSGNQGENQKTTTGIPHAGGENVPEDVRERPVVEFKTPLDEALEQGLLNTDPEQPFEGFEAAAPQAGEKATFDRKSAELRDSHTEAPKKSKKGLIIGGVASLAVAGVTVFGVNALANKNETPTEPTNPDATAPVTPGETQAPTVAPAPEVSPSPTDIPTTFEPTPSATEAPSTPTETEKGSEYSYADLTKMSAEQMVKLPLDDRLVFARGVYNHFNEWSTGQFGEDVLYEQEDTSDIYKFNPNLVANADNKPEEIIKQIIYGKQATLMMQENLSVGGAFNTDAAKKLISTQYADKNFLKKESNNSVMDTKMYEMAVANLKGIERSNTPFPQEITSINDKETFVEEVTDSNGKVRHVAHLSYSLTFTEDAGYLYRLDGGTAEVTFTQEAVYYQPEGESQGMWIITEENSFGVAK